MPSNGSELLDWKDSVSGYERALEQTNYNLLNPQVNAARLNMLRFLKQELTNNMDEDSRVSFEGMIWKNYLYPYIDLFRKMQRVSLVSLSIF
jgi:hypothetical protein